MNIPFIVSAQITSEEDIQGLLSLYPGLLGMQTQSPNAVVGEIISSIENVLAHALPDQFENLKAEMLQVSETAMKVAQNSTKDFSDFKINV